MEYLNAALPWSPLLIATVYSTFAHFYFQLEKPALLVSLIVMAAVWMCTRKWGMVSNEGETTKLLQENQGLRDNLVKVYNMVQQNTRQVKTPPLQQQQAMPPMSQAMPPMSQATPNHSVPTAPGPSGPEEDSEGKPYL